MFRNRITAVVAAAALAFGGLTACSTDSKVADPGASVNTRRGLALALVIAALALNLAAVTPTQILQSATDTAVDAVARVITDPFGDAR